MTGYAYFISEDQVRDWSNWSNNRDINWDRVFYRTAQDRWIKPLLCDDLYAELYAQVELVGLDFDLLPAKWAALREKVEPALAWYIQFEAVNVANVRVNNVGMTENAGQNQTAADDAQTAKWSGMCKRNGDMYAQEVREFLNQNAATYPSWPKKHDIAPPSGSGIFTKAAWRRVNCEKC